MSLMSKIFNESYREEDMGGPHIPGIPGMPLEGNPWDPYKLPDDDTYIQVIDHIGRDGRPVYRVMIKGSEEHQRYVQEQQIIAQAAEAAKQQALRVASKLISGRDFPLQPGWAVEDIARDVSSDSYILTEVNQATGARRRRLVSTLDLMSGLPGSVVELVSRLPAPIDTEEDDQRNAFLKLLAVCDAVHDES